MLRPYTSSAASFNAPTAESIRSGMSRARLSAAPSRSRNAAVSGDCGINRPPAMATGTGPVPVAITGGLLLPQSPLTAAFRDRLAADFKRARLVPERIDAAIGALKLAAELV